MIADNAPNKALPASFTCMLTALPHCSCEFEQPVDLEKKTQETHGQHS